MDVVSDFHDDLEIPASPTGPTSPARRPMTCTHEMAEDVADVPSTKGKSTMSTSNAVKTTTAYEMRSIQRLARFAGGVYLLIAALAGFVHFYVPGELFVPGDATATAGNILASEGLFRWGIASELVLLSSEIVLSILLYVLLKPVSKTLSLIAAASRLAMATVHGANLLLSFLVLLLLSGAGYLAVFDSEQAAALAMLFLDVGSYGFTIGVAFLALHAVLLGYLIYESGYFPRILGVLFVVAAAGYALDAFGHVLLPGYTTGAAYVAVPIALAEVAFPLWLLFKGVNPERWERRAHESAAEGNHGRGAPASAPSLAAAGPGVP